MCQPAFTSRMDSSNSTDISRPWSGRRIAQAIMARGSTVAITRARCSSCELCKTPGGGSHRGNRLADDKNPGKVKYSSAVCSISVTPIRASTALREREGMGMDHLIRIPDCSARRQVGLGTAKSGDRVESVRYMRPRR